MNLTELFVSAIVGKDLLSEGSDMIQDGCDEHGKKILRDGLRNLFMELVGSRKEVEHRWI